MNKKLNFLLIGYSQIAKKRIIKVLLKNKITFSVASKSNKKRIKGAKKQFLDYNYALKNSDANLVYISLPNSLHYVWAKKALSLGYHVIIDKPICHKLSETRELINLAKRKKKLLSEAIFYSYHKQINQAIKIAGGKNKINHVQVNFIIPKPKKNSLLVSKKFKGGVIMDMGPYAASIHRIFFNKEILSKKIIVEKNSTKLPVSFYLLIKYHQRIYTGFFKFGGEYKNEVVFFTKNKTININRVFSPPCDCSLNLKVTKNDREKNYLVKKDDCFENYLLEIQNKLKKKKYTYYLKQIENDHLFRDQINKEA